MLKITSCLKWPLMLQPSHLLPRLITWIGRGGRKRNYLSAESVYFKNPNQGILSVSTRLLIASREARKVGKAGFTVWEAVKRLIRYSKDLGQSQMINVYYTYYRIVS